MPVHISAFPDHRLVVSRPTGVITTRAALGAWRDFFAAAALPAGYDIIIDHHQAQDYQIGFSQMQRLAGFLGETVLRTGGSGRIAHLAPGDLGFGMGRMFEQIATFTAPVEVAVFRDVAGVAKWLARDQAELGALLDCDLAPARHMHR